MLFRKDLYSSGDSSPASSRPPVSVAQPALSFNAQEELGDVLHADRPKDHMIVGLRGFRSGVHCSLD